MITSKEDLVNKILDGQLVEHRFPNIELKKEWNQSYGDKLSALGNKVAYKDLWLVVGINGDGRLAGQTEKWARTTEEIISQHINSCLDPTQACKSIDCVEISNCWIILIRVGNPGAVVYWSNSAYKGSGTTISKMTPEETTELTVSLPGLTDYSKQPWTGSIQERAAQNYLDKVKTLRPDSAINFTGSYSDGLTSIGIADKNTSRILFGDFKYRVVFYNKENEPAKNDTRTGLFSLLTDDFIREVQNWPESQISALKNSFPERALREGIANSVAHAAYFESFGDLILEVFIDKIVISNLCLPESGYFANKWFSRSHKSVNALLMETLRLGGYVDELGRGKNLIFGDSIKNGKKSPLVSIERAGRFNRWRLTIFGGATDKNQLKLLKRIREVYSNENKALIAFSLVLWKQLPVSTIRSYIGDESVPLFAEVIDDLDGPIFYYKKEDRIYPHRWVRILMEEGKDSKAFSPAEEDRLYDLALDIHTKHHGGSISPKELRKLAHMGETDSEVTLCSALFKKWVKEKKVTKIKRGHYKFIKKAQEKVPLSQILDLFKQKPQ